MLTLYQVIAFCHYAGLDAMPDGWECYRWTAGGGYANRGDTSGAANRHREVVWFSPGCLRPKKQPTLLDFMSDEEEVLPMVEEEEEE